VAVYQDEVDEDAQVDFTGRAKAVKRTYSRGATGLTI
jgi:hypothetical protein